MLQPTCGRDACRAECGVLPLRGLHLLAEGPWAMLDQLFLSHVAPCVVEVDLTGSVLGPAALRFIHAWANTSTAQAEPFTLRCESFVQCGA